MSTVQIIGTVVSSISYPDVVQLMQNFDNVFYKYKNQNGLEIQVSINRIKNTDQDLYEVEYLDGNAKQLLTSNDFLKAVDFFFFLLRENPNNKTSVSTIQFNIEGKRYWFYTDDYCNGQGITWGPGKLSYVETAPSSTRIPKQIVPQPGFEDGWIRSLKDFELLYCKDDHQITSIEEYLEILNRHLK